MRYGCNPGWKTLLRHGKFYPADISQIPLSPLLSEGDVWQGVCTMLSQTKWRIRVTRKGISARVPFSGGPTFVPACARLLRNPLRIPHLLKDLRDPANLPILLKDLRNPANLPICSKKRLL
jgi:hypothetical protein